MSHPTNEALVLLSVAFLHANEGAIVPQQHHHHHQDALLLPDLLSFCPFDPSERFRVKPPLSMGGVSGLSLFETPVFLRGKEREGRDAMATNAAEATVLASAEVPEALEAEAFRTIYPKQFFQRFLDSGLRPDGRETTTWREASLGARAVTNADGSCLSKLGNTSVLAGVKLEVMVPEVELPDRGKLVVHVEMASTCSSETRPGKPSNKAQDVAADVVSAINACNAVDLQQMCIVEGQAAWVAYLDLYCLEDDGSVFDAALLAAMGALQLTELPAVHLNKGMVTYAADEDAMEVGEGSFHTSRRRLKVKDLALSSTVGFYQGHRLFDPTHEEELLLESSATVALNEAGKVVFFRVPGGTVELDEEDVLACIEAARRRYRELHALLEAELDRPPLHWA